MSDFWTFVLVFGLVVVFPFAVQFFVAWLDARRWADREDN